MGDLCYRFPTHFFSGSNLAMLVYQPGWGRYRFNVIFSFGNIHICIYKYINIIFMTAVLYKNLIETFGA